MKKAIVYFQRGSVLHSVELSGESIWLDIPAGEYVQNPGNFGGIYVSNEENTTDEDDATRAIFGSVVYVDIQDVDD